MGHGIGLALVGQATRRHHGTVDVGRADDFGRADDAGVVGALLVYGGFVGAVFTVRLPLAAEVAS